MEMYQSPFVELSDMVDRFGLPSWKIQRLAFDYGVQRPPIGLRSILKKRMEVYK